MVLLRAFFQFLPAKEETARVLMLPATDGLHHARQPVTADKQQCF
jgi:hypothetical protein